MVNACVSLNNMPRLQAAGERWRRLEWKGRQLREWVVANEGCQPHFGAVGCCHVVVLGIDHGDPGKTWHRRAGTLAGRQGAMSIEGPLPATQGHQERLWSRVTRSTQGDEGSL